MNYPKLNEIPTTRDLLDKFKGYNHNLRIGEGEFYDMQNLTGDDYPILSPRKKRGTYVTTSKVNGMCSNTKFCYVAGRDIILKDTNGQEEVYDMSLTDSQKSMVSIGANIVILPDQKYINTVDALDRGGLRTGVYTIPSAIAGSTLKPKAVLTLALKTPDGKYRTLLSKAQKNKVIISPKSFPVYGADFTQKSPDVIKEKDITEDMDEKSYLVLERDDLWYVSEGSFYGSNTYHHIYDALMIPISESDKSVINWNVKWYRQVDGTIDSDGDIGWASLDTSRTKLSRYIVLYALDDDVEYLERVIENLTSKSIVSIEGIDDLKLFHEKINTATIIDCENSETSVERKGIVISGDGDDEGWVNLLAPDLHETKLFQPRVYVTPIDIKTDEVSVGEMPSMDFVIESGNRLWGCKYGANNEGSFVNEIYASVLGDFKVWSKTDGISTDSYTASVGTSGPFTGAINYGGKPIFFKEDCMHRVFGDYSPYSVQMIPCKGVQEGCGKSLAIVNDVLYYKSRTGVCAYDGSLPVEISTNFGDKQYRNAVGGAIGNKYYLSMQDEADEWHLFVYDTIKKMWHKEDDTQVTQFCNHKGELYYIDYSDKFIRSIKGTGVKETEPVQWYAETGILGATTPDDKYVTKIDIRMSVAKGSKVSLHIEYDSMGEWERLMEIEGLTLNTFTIPVRPRRCDHFRLKFEGEGDAKIYSISKTMEETE